ncbi:hypothetical protein EGW08_009125 [Elysia chlorotica]|uniref:Uncharacterized protein n=1 Tax=Elysia chlorotica TaxID=188477 RepID=A0A433TNC5_ELYCH|nr:hypothetical protein EGW08_009125 [Elysia chlorotica]
MKPWPTRNWQHRCWRTNLRDFRAKGTLAPRHLLGAPPGRSESRALRCHAPLGPRQQTRTSTTRCLTCFPATTMPKVQGRWIPRTVKAPWLLKGRRVPPTWSTSFVTMRWPISVMTLLTDFHSLRRRRGRGRRRRIPSLLLSAPMTGRKTR